MPVEIKELIVSTTINPPGFNDSSGPGAGGEALTEETMLLLQNKIIQECMNQVAELLEKWDER